jgi:flagellar hook protein FlgE
VGDIEFRFDTNGLSQFADVNGTASVSTLNQNGYGAGEFVSVAINDSGRVVATYSNGERIDMAQVVTAEFNAINKLKRLDGGVFSGLQYRHFGRVHQAYRHPAGLCRCHAHCQHGRRNAPGSA